MKYENEFSVLAFIYSKYQEFYSIVLRYTLFPIDKQGRICQNIMEKSCEIEY